jgi:exo-poly-alpha-galacturonosidase
MLKRILSILLILSIVTGGAVMVSAENLTPQAPVNVAVPAAATTYSSISIIWDKPEDYKDITGYEVYINGSLVETTAANETYYTAENLEPDTEYTFTVKSLIGSSESESSSEITAKTDVKGTVHNVTEVPYNAAGDGKTLDTAAIQAAIDDCADNDIVLIPEEYTFLTGALDLKSNMTLEVNGTLLSSMDAADFEKTPDENKSYTGGTATGVIYTDEAPKRLIWSRVEGWEQYCYRSLINIGYLDEETDYGNDESYVCSNVKICGTGTITGDSYRANYAPINGNATALAIDEGKSADTFYDIANSETTENNIRSRIRGRLINVSNAQNVYIKGVTVAKPPMWTIHMIYSDNVTTNGVTFNTSGYRNGDGWDPDSSTNCTIFNCSFNTGDDCVAIKSGKNPEGNTVNRPSENIKVIGCTSDGGLGLAVGSEMSGGVSGVYVRDCILSNTRYGIELKANKVRGGYIKDFHVQDSTVDRVLIHSVTYNADGEAADTSPVFSDMTFKNMNILGYSSESSSKPWLSTSIEIEGFTNDSGTDDYYVKNISFDDIVVGTENNVTQNISMKYCRNIAFNNVLQSDESIPLYPTTDTTFTVDGGQLSDIIPKFTSSIEAEKMNLDGYAFESNSAASSGGCVSANSSGKGTAKAQFNGEDGKYNLTISYFDENDGKAEYKLYVNDTQVDTWIADKDLGSASADEKTLTTHETTLSLKKGDIISIEGTKETYDPARVDKIELERLPDLEVSTPTISDGKVTATVTSNVNEAKTAVLIVASYENGVMKNVSISDETTISANGSVSLETAAPTTDEYKIMVWNSLQSMIPIIN